MSRTTYVFALLSSELHLRTQPSVFFNLASNLYSPCIVAVLYIVSALLCIFVCTFKMCLPLSFWTTILALGNHTIIPTQVMPSWDYVNIHPVSICRIAKTERDIIFSYCLKHTMSLAIENMRLVKFPMRRLNAQISRLLLESSHITSLWKWQS